MHRCIFALLCAVLLGACAQPTLRKEGAVTQEISGTPALIRWFFPYRTQVPQGVYQSAEVVSQVKGGMSKETVQNVLGTPPILDPFHDGRWDYPFRYDDGKGTVTWNTLSLFFNEKGALVSIQGDNLPEDVRYLQLLSRTE